MEIQLNQFIKVEVESRVTIFHLNNEEKVEKVLYLRNDKIIGAELAKYKFFSFKKFFIVLLLAITGGLVHFLYDTQVLKFEPNPTLISLIAGGILIIGLFFCFTKSRHLRVLVDSDDTGPLQRSRFSFPVGSEISEKQLMDLMYLLST